MSVRRESRASCDRRRLLAGLGGLVVASVTATYPAHPAGVSDRPGPAQPKVSPGFVEFTDERAGFALVYPQGWDRLSDPDPQVVLLATQDTRYSLRVRVVELRNPIGFAQLPAAREVTDRIVAANPTARLLEGPRQVAVGGLPSLFYFYTFTDPTNGELGVHSHIFAFRDTTMIALLLQAVPATGFHAEASTFDHITGSFRTL